MDLNQKIDRIMSMWWARILIFFALSVLFTFTLGACSSFFSDELFGIQRRVLEGFVIFSSLFFSSFIVESLTPGSKALAFGLILDKFSLKDIINGCIIVAIAILFTIIISMILGGNMISNPDNLDPINFLWFTFMIIFFATNEELAFRGIIFQSLIEKFNPFIITFIISFIFAFVHSFNPNVSQIGLVNVFLAGVLLSTMYIATNSLWLPITFHIVWNWSQHVLVGSPISGFDMNNEVFILQFAKNSSLSEFLFGSTFGLEEGWFTTLFLILMTFIVAKYSEQSPFTNRILFKKRLLRSRSLYV